MIFLERLEIILAIVTFFSFFAGLVLDISEGIAVGLVSIILLALLFLCFGWLPA